MFYMLKILKIMISAPKSTKAINAFVFCPIPSAKDLYLRYGERLSKGEYACTAGEIGQPAMVSATSTIGQMIQAEKMLVADTQPTP